MLVCIIAAILSSVANSEDPCLRNNHRELRDGFRSTSFRTEPPEVPHCDSTLESGWYRFNSKAGDRMPEHFAERNMCGTIVPIWMSGTHPSIDEGEATRKACANLDTGGSNPHCEQSINIGVKNCTDFYVYFLHPTPGCPIGYCAGDKAPCPAGQWSENDNFPPGCEDAFPELTGAPVLRGPTVYDAHKFRFSCSFAPKESFSVHNRTFEVRWTFDNAEVPDIQPVPLKDPQRTVDLDGLQLKGHLGKNLGCKIVAYYDDKPDGVKSPWMKSNVYWAGIEPESYLKLISESEEMTNVTLSSTLPILCDEKTIDEFCCVNIELQIKPSDENSAPKAGPMNRCRWPMCKNSSHPPGVQEAVTVNIISDVKNIVDGRNDLLLAFKKVQATVANTYSSVFDGHGISSVQIDVAHRDAKICYASGDPHLTTFDGVRFDVYHVGDFTLYERKDRNFEVQIRTWPCGDPDDLVSCICGVAMRENDDLIIVDACDISRFTGSSPALEIRVPRGFLNGTVVKQATDGSKIAVLFPSGSEITAKGIRWNHHHGVVDGYMGVEMTLPPSDLGKGGGGLCGTYDGNPSNDFTNRDNTLGRRLRNRRPDKFTLSWINNGTDSLFRETPPPVYVPHLKQFCQCDPTKTPALALCTLNAKSILACKNCGVKNFATDNSTKNCSFKCEGGWSRQRRQVDAVYEDMDEIISSYDPADFADFIPADATFPTRSGKTEQNAKDACKNGLKQSLIWQQCNFTITDDFLQPCMEDIKVGDSYDPVDSLVDVFTSMCQLTLAKDRNNYHTNGDGQVVLKPEVSTDICTTNCLKHGTCKQGVCQCHEGWVGDNCQLPANQPPILYRVRGAPLCDIQQRPCQKVFIDADYIQMKDTFACKIKEILPDGTDGNTWIEDAEFLSALKLSCPLPVPDKSVRKLSIQVTVDGQTYSNSTVVTVFDSICQNCTEAGCQKLPDTCLIDDLCFLDGDEHPDDASRMCVIAESMMQWTRVFPAVDVSLQGPDASSSLTCTVSTHDTSPAAMFSVAWYVEGQLAPNTVPHDLPTGTLAEQIHRTKLPALGNVTCQVRSSYATRGILSPPYSSNAVDLSLSPLYPPFSVQLARPSAGNSSVICRILTSDTNPLARYKVSWYVDGVAYPRERELRIPNGEFAAAYSTADLPSSGKLSCKIRSFYDDVNIMSPYIVSDALPL